MKGKGEKIYPFECRVPKNSKEREAFFSHQCKEIEENNRMRKTRDLFKKIRATKVRKQQLELDTEQQTGSK